MSKKIGVVSLYYKNRNYGGLLQAYALVSYLNKLHLDAEQICVVRNEKSVNKAYSIKDALKLIVKKIIEFSNIKNLQLRNKCFDYFENSVPHSEEIYDSDSIVACNYSYNTFIAGSDQVWNMSWAQPEYFLNFVDESKQKISYAASMPDVELSQDQEKKLYDYLVSFDSISVREKTTQKKLEEMKLGKNINLAIDPTMLLAAEDWSEVIEDAGMNNDFIFCYFLSGKKELRDAAKFFAKKKGLPLVTLPHLNSINIPDVNFGDVRLYDVSVGRLLGLINKASYILTDSFHVTVFSNLFKKKYIVFSRAENRKMDARVIDLLYLRNESKRFIFANKDNFESFNTIIDCDLNSPSLEYSELINNSKEYLKRNLMEA